MSAQRGNRYHQGGGGYVTDDNRIRQIVTDLLAPLYAKLDSLREELAELKQRPREVAESRRGDIIVICSVIGAIVAISTCGSGLLGIGVAILLHFAK